MSNCKETFTGKNGSFIARSYGQTGWVNKDIDGDEEYLAGLMSFLDACEFAEMYANREEGESYNDYYGRK